MQQRSRRLIRFAALSLALTLAAAACGGSNKTSGGSSSTTVPTGETAQAKPQPGGSLTYAIEADASAGYCLPTATLAAGGIQVANAIYDPLFQFDADFKPQPYLAASYSWDPTYTAMTIKLRDGVKFQDGTTLDSAAVKLNYDLARGEPGAVARTGLQPLLFIFVFQNIDHIDAPDPLTVVFHTKLAWPALPDFLALGRNGIVAPAQLMAGKDHCKDHLIGSGPFMEKSPDDWVPNDHMNLVRNPNYWRKDKNGVQLPYLDKLTFKPIEGGPARFDALDGNTVQAGHWSSQSIFDQISKDSRFRLIAEAQGHKETGYGMVNVGKAPLNDKSIREHLGMAINRDTLNQINSDGKFKISNQPFDTGVIAYDPTIKAPKYDPPTAKAFFTGKNIKLKLSYATDPTTKAIADEVKAELGEVGVDLTVDEKDQATLISQAIAGNFDILLFRNHPGADPDTEYNWWHSGSPVNFGHINDPEVDKWLDAGRIEPDPTKRKTDYQNMNRALEAGEYNLWNWYTEWAVGSYKKVHNLTGTTLPDGSPGSGLTWGYHLLTETWIEH